MTAGSHAAAVANVTACGVCSEAVAPLGLCQVSCSSQGAVTPYLAATAGVLECLGELRLA